MKTNHRWLTAIGLLLLSWAMVAPGQAPAPPAPQAKDKDKQEPVVRVTTRLVQISVVVQRDGQPVSDLKREDFSVFDEGQPQAISVFSVESITKTAAPPEPLPPNTFSNRFERQEGMPTSVTVVLLDGMNTRFEDQTYAKEEVVKFLQQLRPDDRVALYLLGRSGVRVLHDFTSDARPLLRVLARYRGKSSAEVRDSEANLADTGDAELDQWLNEMNERIAAMAVTNRVLWTLRGLEAIANHLSGLPGRKNLVWVSSGFPISFGETWQPTATNPIPERREFTGEIAQAMRAVNNANMAIYPVDARGLIGAFGEGAVMGRQPFRRASIGMLGPTFDTMNTIAERTGGRAFYNTNDIQVSIRRAIDDTRVTYRLGYYPNHGQWDGKFRRIKVKVNRSGVRVRYRQGYYAMDNPPPLTEKAREKALLQAANSPLGASALGLTVQATPITIGNMVTLDLKLTMDPHEVSIELKDNRWVGGLDLVFLQQGEEGKRVGAISHTIDMNLRRATYEALLRDGISLVKKIELAPGAEELRVVARDVTSGAVGTVTIPLESLLKPSRTQR